MPREPRTRRLMPHPLVRLSSPPTARPPALRVRSSEVVEVLTGPGVSGVDR